MKVKFAMYIANCGDGSCVVKFFRNEENAEKFASKDDERYCDDVYSKTLEFDDEGNLLTPEPTRD